MKPLGREPSTGAQRQRVLGDCATLGPIELRKIRPPAITLKARQEQGALGSRVCFHEWLSHLTETVGAQADGGAARLLPPALQSTTPATGGVKSVILCICLSSARPGRA